MRLLNGHVWALMDGVWTWRVKSIRACGEHSVAKCALSTLIFISLERSYTKPLAGQWAINLMACNTIHSIALSSVTLLSARNHLHSVAWVHQHSGTPPPLTGDLGISAAGIPHPSFQPC